VDDLAYTLQQENTGSRFGNRRSTEAPKSRECAHD
jgi:hypothetical protein